MPVSRMRMRPWLEMMIDSGSITGLRWIDKERTMFSIPWKHAARHGWEMDKDASLFMKWAQHTGKYANGQNADPKTWKANFRCAMNSLPDIEEVKDKSINKGQQAVRVYRLLPLSTKSKDTRRRARERKSSHKRVKTEDTDDSDVQSPLGMEMRSPEDMSSPQENTVDSTDNRACMPASEIPDWSYSVEIDSTNNFTRRLEVSPAHTTGALDYDVDDIIQICQQMEKDGQWLPNTSNGTGSLINETCMESCSPGSSWSESSADDVDDMRQYTVLDNNIIDDGWVWPQQIAPLFAL